MKKKEYSVLYIKTIYTLFIGLLILNRNKTKKYFILNSSLSQEIKDKILKKYEGISIDETIPLKGVKKYWNKFIMAKKINKVIKIFSRNSTVYGYLYKTFIGDILKSKFKYCILEDGLANYELKSRNRKKINFKNFLLGGNIFEYQSYGVDSETEKIYLTGLTEIPKEIENKVILINLKELWNLKSEDEKNEILEIFSIYPSEIDVLKDGKNILFTQPLSEDYILSENEKIELYRKIMKNYSEKEVLIKPHPREKTDYKKVFQKATILKRETPFELLVLLGVQFEKAITIFSTAAFSLGKNIEIDFYGTEIHSKLYKRFGGLENIKIERKKLEVGFSKFLNF
ncbi:glycosyltransferase family 52 [Cetobacterium sp. ZOR0034]|uniref:glycosyltransferase family 52 n=1 Tax=Cetobacterium sp. ZOR0034 TaxID=1339239 RepID=UPI00068DBF53|nr:glycosyltransferase family 52 [Cetobacterium sp. ZOR0034]